MGYLISGRCKFWDAPLGSLFVTDLILALILGVRVRPIILAEEERLTTATKRASLTHNLLVDEICK